MANTYVRRQPGNLIGKPASGEAGASVFVLRKDDSNASAILQTLTGDEAAKETLYPMSVFGYRGKYAVVQEMLDESTAEKRVIIAAGKIVAAMAKYKNANDHRARTTHPDPVGLAELDLEETTICDAVANRLVSEGILFAGLDVLSGRVLDINIVNPGGLSQLDARAQESSYRSAVAAIESAVEVKIARSRQV